MAMRHFGWKRQAHDSRDLRFFAPESVLATLPAAADLSVGLGVQLNQADLGSCGPNTAAENIMYDDGKQALSVTTPSRLFMYYNTRQLMGTVNEDSGVDNRTMLKALAQYGFCDETLWPYVTSRFTQKPPASCYTTAQANRITSYATVTQSLAQMKGCIASGLPFIFGFSVFQQIESPEAEQTGLVRLPSPGEQSIGGHDVLFCGYSDQTQLFKFRNHWLRQDGRPWGDNGYGYLPYAYAASPQLAGDFWVINAVPGSVVPPPPTPTPVPPSPQPQPPGPTVNIKAIIDSVFAQIEAGFAKNIMIVMALKAVNALIDQWLDQHVQLRSASSVVSVSQAQTLVDQIFADLKTRFAGNTFLTMMLGNVQALVDQFLSDPAKVQSLKLAA